MEKDFIERDPQCNVCGRKMQYRIPARSPERYVYSVCADCTARRLEDLIARRLKSPISMRDASGRRVQSE